MGPKMAERLVLASKRGCKQVKTYFLPILGPDPLQHSDKTPLFYPNLRGVGIFSERGPEALVAH